MARTARAGGRTFLSNSKSGTGRRIGADVVVSGDLQKVGSQLKLSLRLHETQGGQLLAAEVDSGKNIDDLDTAASEAADRLLGG